MLRSIHRALNAGSSRRWTRSVSSANSDNLFGKVLIANRGEIACRVIDTCKRLGIRTVAVHSDADYDALHVRMADEAFCVGPPPSDQSYLNVNSILEACRRSGAEAVHPGYGFLSEKISFMESLEKEGISFIGPGKKALEIMGDKVNSKQHAKDAGVNVIPGDLRVVKTADECVQVANSIGYPVMVKAAAGGGGKGMRIAFNAEEVHDVFGLCSREGLKFFSDDRLLVEKFVEQPRHIEVQILADAHDTIFLNERECSLQRRNQKVIEEAPSRALTPELRLAMGAQAVQLARSVDYRTAGTVEFLFSDTSKDFFFLEMNTRLQVEHPVTEFITGVDLVEQMIRIAAGQRMTCTQDQVLWRPERGWAFESRVYAEDPYNNFNPSVGRLAKYAEPATGAAAPDGAPRSALLDSSVVRVDSGVVEGSVISMNYDPMIAKLITFGETRDVALDRMVEALDEYVIEGVSTNVDFLRDICEHPRFREGRLVTSFIPEEYAVPKGHEGDCAGPFLGPSRRSEQDDRDTALLATLVAAKRMVRDASVSGQTGAPKDPNAAVPRHLKVSLVRSVEPSSPPVVRDVEVLRFDAAAGVLEASVDGGEPVALHSAWELKDALLTSTVDGEKRKSVVRSVGASSVRLQHHGASYDVRVEDADLHRLRQFMPASKAAAAAKMLLSPMGGKIVNLFVKPGSAVNKGQAVAEIEAMKMINTIKAPKRGVIKAISVASGDTVDAGSIVYELEE